MTYGDDTLGYWSPTQPVIPEPQMQSFGLSPADIAASPIPNPNFGGFGGLARRAAVGFGNGLTKLGAGLFPINPQIAATMSPDQIQGLRQNSLLSAGLGVMGAAGSGQRFGPALASGIFGAQRQMQGALGQQFALSEHARERAHQDSREALGDQRYNQERADTLSQRGFENQLQTGTLAARVAQYKAQTSLARAQLERLSKVSPDKQAELDQLNKDRGEVDTILSRMALDKQGGTMADKIRLNYLTGGREAPVMRADPFGMLGGFGAGAQGDPVLDDPRY